MKGQRLLADGHNHQAAIVLERAAQVEPRKSSIREAFARALFNSGQTDRAKEEFAMVVELDPSNDYGYFGLGLCHARQGELTVARGHLKLAVVMRPEVDAYRQALNRLTC
ncbi:MAG: tetratricopeptide repeat protein [Actinomycetota bacterium]